MYASAARVMQLANGAEQLLVAADATENATFVALVAGYRQDLERLHKRICEPLGLKGIHMRRLARKTKETILQQLENVSPSPAAVCLQCLKINLGSQREVAEKERPTPYYPTGRLYEAVNRSAMEEIKRAVEPSLQVFGIRRNWSTLTIEVDKDTERLVKTTGAAVTSPGPAHELADAVAWSNHANRHVKCVGRHDLVQNVSVRVRKRLKR
jgi:hypothetical protein